MHTRCHFSCPHTDSLSLKPSLAVSCFYQPDGKASVLSLLQEKYVPSFTSCCSPSQFMTVPHSS
jgi:hypothetical protein